VSLVIKASQFRSQLPSSYAGCDQTLAHVLTTLPPNAFIEVEYRVKFLAIRFAGDTLIIPLTKGSHLHEMFRIDSSINVQ
jgi:hypothetical protein